MSEGKLRGDALSPRVKAAVPRDDYALLLTFNNGERRMFNAKPLLALPAFRPLKNPDFFRLVQVSYGSVAWPRDIDYCPDTLYAESVPIDAGGSHA
ncbi:MAG: DUF2442 domain-containing protein [Oscillospiraceae bacterium]|nr:DUF2442 domain-containing protein [Oscillospiraceae bacterium]